MPSPIIHTSPYPRVNHDNLNASCTDIDSESPCKRRPDTGQPCVLLKDPKTCDICKNCLLLGKGNAVPTHADALPKCMVIDCDIGATIGGYCSICYNIICTRRNTWSQRHKTDPPGWWLNRPIINNNNNHGYL